MRENESRPETDLDFGLEIIDLLLETFLTEDNVVNLLLHLVTHDGASFLLFGPVL